MKKEIANQLHPVPNNYRWRITDKTYLGDYKVELQRMKMPFWWVTVEYQNIVERSLPMLNELTKRIWDAYQHTEARKQEELRLKKSVTGVTKI